MPRRVLRFSIKNDENVVVRWENATEEGEGTGDVFTIESIDLPKVELTDALQKMAEHAGEIMELSDKARQAIKVRGIKLSWKHGICGLIITGDRRLVNSKAPVVFNTPLFTEKLYADTDGKNIFTPECADDLQKLSDLIFEFVDGDRAQRELQFELEEGQAM